MERTFKHFPKNIKCPVCGTNRDDRCFLLPIDGTGDGTICEAQPTHVSCLVPSMFRFNKENGLLYCKLLYNISDD